MERNPKERKCRENQKMDVEKNTKIEKTKCRSKYKKNVFDQNFDGNSFFRAKFNFSESPRKLKHQKVNRQQQRVDISARKSKNILTFFLHLSCTRTDYLT